MIKPTKILLEASSICQLRCHSCFRFTSSFQATIGNGFLKFNDFKNFIDHNPGILFIELSNWGEIFLNPELLDIIRYANSQNIMLSANNGVNLNNVNEDILEALVKYKFNSLTISIDGACHDTYKIYRIRGNFENVMSNINKINFFKKKYQSERPFLNWQFVVFGHNEHELPIARQMASDMGMHFFPKLTWDEDFSPIKDQAFVKRETGLSIVSRKEYKQKYGVDIKQDICNALWDYPQFNWDGKVLGCARNFWSDFGGNVFTDGLLGAINNEKMEYARGMLLGKKVGREDIPCFTCSIYQLMVINNKFLKRNKGFIRSSYYFLRLNKLRKFLNLYLTL